MGEAIGPVTWVWSSRTHMKLEVAVPLCNPGAPMLRLEAGAGDSPGSWTAHSKQQDALSQGREHGAELEKHGRGLTVRIS